jgi:hypothetical protein
MSEKYKKERERLLNIIDILDISAEANPLNPAGRRNLKNTHVCHNKLR